MHSRLTDERKRAAANELLAMRRERRIEPGLPIELRPADLVDAYAVQDLVVDGLLAGGDRVLGYKVACTSEIAQQALLIDGPLFGRIVSSSTSASGATLATDGFVHRVVEAEFGFRIGSDVAEVAGGHTHDSISDHIDAVIPAIEIVDYRYESWSVGAFSIAADNAIHGWWVHGAPMTDWRRHDLAATAVVVQRNDETVTTGSGAAVLGHPLTVMAWLADELPRHGRRLRAGDVVTTGVTTDVFEAASGDHIEADFAGIGTVALHFD